MNAPNPHDTNLRAVVCTDFEGRELARYRCAGMASRLGAGGHGKIIEACANGRAVRGRWFRFADDPTPPDRIPVRFGASYPIKTVDAAGDTVRTYPSITAVARGLGTSCTTARRALECGYPIDRVWLRYADMPDDCQPLRPRGKRGPKPGYKVNRRRVPTPKEDPYAPGGRLHDLAAMRLRK